MAGDWKAALQRQILQAVDSTTAQCEHAGDTLYLYCADSRPLLSRLSGLQIPHLLRRPAGLEDLFLKLAGRSLEE